jgi:hypothetical protein
MSIAFTSSVLVLSFVMPGFMPGIHAFLLGSKAWMAGTSPAMTTQ